MKTLSIAIVNRLQLKLLMLTITLLLLLAFESVLAQNDGIPRGAQLPYTRYEAEDGRRGGAAALQQTLNHDYNTIAAEATNQAYVSLPSNGSYVEWTTTAAFQGFNMRFTMPDNASGTGNSGSLALIINGTKVQNINLSSYWAYQYFHGGATEPEQHPGGKVFMEFDEIHFRLANSYPAGTVVRIAKDNGDAFTYGVDFLELEPVPQALPAPANSLSVTDYGANGSDNVDDFAAFNACLAAASQQGKNVYIPAGKFLLSDKWTVNVSNMKILGAGVWHTEIWFTTDKQFYGGIYARSTNVEIGHFSLNTNNNDRFKYDEQNARVPADPYKIYKGFMGTYGTGSRIHDVWVEHFECGFWIAGYDPPYPIDITQDLIISRARIRNNYADGVNFCQGTSNSVVEYSNIRNSGDDGLAMWPNNAFSAPTEVNNIFRYNTIENTWRAGGIAIFGGHGHQVFRNIIKDGVGGSAIRFTNDFPGYKFENGQTPIVLTDNWIERCGTTYDLWNRMRGAIEFNVPQGVFDMEFNNTTIINSQRHAFNMEGSFTNVKFNNTTIDGTGLDAYVDNPAMDDWGGFAIRAQANGKVTFNNVSFNRIESYKAGTDPVYGNIKNHNTGFIIEVINTNVPLSSISMSPATLSLAEGQSSNLTVTYSPTNATNKTLTWTSSNAAVASVSESGTGIATITALSIGSTTITARSADGNKTATATVNVTPAVNITTPDASAGEGGNTASFRIGASAVSSNVTVNYTISGTATSSDYTASPSLSGSVTLTPSAPAVTITVTPNDDTAFEGAETLTLTLQPGSGFSLGGNTTATISIADNENPPCTAPVIGFTSSAPAIDQSIDAVWNNTPAGTISNVTLGSMPSDFSGSRWRAMYDATNLYVLVEVKDNNRYNDSGGSWWEDDVVEVFIDGDNSKGTSYDGANDFQLGFRYNSTTVNVGGNSVNNTTGIVFAIQNVTGGYNLEARIPWSTIGVTPSTGSRIGFDISVDDDDNGGTRDAQVSAFATSAMGWSNPSLFGSVYLTTCGTPPPPVAVTGVSVSPTSASIGVGGTQQLTATVSPANATNKNVTWTSNNTSVATVNASGVVTGVAAGNATITVRTEDGNFTATSAITVTSSNVAVTGVTVSPTSASLSVGGTQQLTATVSPSNATNKNVTWTSNNTSVATVNSSGLVTAVSAGSATITVRTQDGNFTATSTIAVTSTTQTPYPGPGAALIPGTIQAENFDNGGQGVAFNDLDATNNGGQYRTTAVDIEACSEGGFNVGWIGTGEWLEYTVNVTAGTYTLSARVATPNSGKTFHVELDGVNISGSIAVPNTGGWQSWQTVSVTTTALSAGNGRVLRLVFDTNDFNVNSITFGSTPPPTSAYRIKNRWQNTYLYDAGDRVRYSTSASGTSYNWVMESVGNGQFELKNVSTGEYMHIENLTGYIQCTARTSGWASSRWSTEDAGSGFVRIKNAWQPTNFIHVENLAGHAQHGTINSAWWSAQWVLEPVSGARQATDQISMEVPEDEAVSYWPNTVVDELHIRSDGSFDHVQVVDLIGRSHIREHIAGKKEVVLNVSRLTGGLHIVKMNGKNRSYTFRIIKK